MNELTDYAGADGLKRIDGIRILVELLQHTPNKHCTKEYNLRITDDKTVNQYYIYAKKIQSKQRSQQ